MRNSSFTITTFAALAFAMPAAAETFYDQARVLDTQPVYETRQVPVQVQECGYEQPSTPRPVDPTTLGDARATEPGADLLGALARDVELREAPAEIYRCRMATRMESKNELAGYRVRYEYEGRVYERRMAEQPGDTIRVGVQLTASQSRSRRLR